MFTLLLACYTTTFEQPSRRLPPAPQVTEAPAIKPTLDPASVGMDAAAMTTLLERTSASHSDSLLIARGDDIIVRWTSHTGGEPPFIETMSLTKSIVSLGFGLLLDDGAITSLEQPVSTWIPEWAGERGEVTLRHLLEHTSGLDPAAPTDIYRSRSFVRHATNSEMLTKPGEAWAYNNNSANLLMGIAEEASGLPMDEVINERLFIPMGLGARTWRHDRSGTPQGMAGLALSADDLYAIGRLLLQDGQWDGQQLISPAWLAQSMVPTEASDRRYGLQWWLLYQEDQPEPIGYWASGWLGQHLVVLPKYDVVAVRQKIAKPDRDTTAEPLESFKDFPTLVIGLVTDSSEAHPSED